MKIMVVAPHADDEILGCGGTLSRYRDENPNSEIIWLLVTDMKQEWGYEKKSIDKKEKELNTILEILQPLKLIRLGFRPSTLDKVGLIKLILDMSNVINKFQPDIIFVPWRHDAHSDHQIAFDASIACTKSFIKSFNTWFSFTIYVTKRQNS